MHELNRLYFDVDSSHKLEGILALVFVNLVMSNMLFVFSMVFDVFFPTAFV